MRKQSWALIRRFAGEESGQSITEYGAIIAFVGVMVALAFNLAHNGFFATLTQSYSCATSSLSQLNYTATNGT